MATRSHVPKFGNWEKDNIPYTSFFENARKEKAGMRMNPNDPEQNPEAFNADFHQYSNNEGKMNLSLKKTRRKSDSNDASINGFSPSVVLQPTHSRQRSSSYLHEDLSHQRSASIPRFGAWDETDPKSGEGFTVIFNRVKEEKHVASTKFPNVPSKHPINSQFHKLNHNPSTLSKICCCLSPSTRD